MKTDYGTPVRLKKETKEEIKKYGEFGESYDELIFKLVKGYRILLEMKGKSKQQKWLEKNSNPQQ